MTTPPTSMAASLFKGSESLGSSEGQSASRGAGLGGPSPRFGEGVLLFIIVMGTLLSVGMTERPWFDGLNLGLLVAGGLYLSIFLGPARWTGASTLGSWITVALRLLLILGMQAALAHQETFGMAWILGMPLLVEARTRFSLPGVGVVAGALLLGVVVHAAFLGGLQTAVEATLGLGTIAAFVLLFTDSALREREARAESDRMAGELESANRRLQALLETSEELAAARERQRLARDIHDSLGHALTVAGIQAESAAVLVDEDPDEARRRMQRVAELSREALGEVRRAVAALRSSPLEEAGLIASLEKLVEASGDAGLAADLVVTGDHRDLSLGAGEALFRAAQEGLTNARRHAAASRVDLRLDYSEDAVRLVVEDDGSGGEVTRSGFGLVGLEERLRSVGGALQVEKGSSGGVQLRAEVPG